VPQFVSRLATMRRSLGAAADQNLLVDTRAAGHLLSAPQGLNHFLVAAREASAEVIVLDPLYSTHDQDENDTRSMAALCQSLLRLRDASKAALIVVHLSRVVQYLPLAHGDRQVTVPIQALRHNLARYTAADLWREAPHIVRAYSDARNSSSSGLGAQGAAWPSERSTVFQNASRACRFVFMFALV
jgi:RecA-family ATPase